MSWLSTLASTADPAILMKKHQPKWVFPLFIAKGREADYEDNYSSFKDGDAVDSQRVLLDHFVRIFPARLLMSEPCACATTSISGACNSNTISN